MQIARAPSEHLIMAKQYNRRQSGLILPDDSIAMPKPDLPRPWYAGRLSAARAMSRRKCCCAKTNCTTCAIPMDLVATVPISWTNYNCTDCAGLSTSYTIHNPPPDAPCPPEFLYSVCQWRYVSSHDCGTTGSYVHASLYIPYPYTFPCTAYLSVGYKDCSTGSTTTETWSADLESCDDFLASLSSGPGQTFTHVGGATSGASPPCYAGYTDDATLTS